MGRVGWPKKKNTGTLSRASQSAVWAVMLLPRFLRHVPVFFFRGWSRLFVLVSERSALSSGRHKEEKEE